MRVLSQHGHEVLKVVSLMEGIVYSFLHISFAKDHVILSKTLEQVDLELILYCQLLLPKYGVDCHVHSQSQIQTSELSFQDTFGIQC